MFEANETCLARTFPHVFLHACNISIVSSSIVNDTILSRCIPERAVRWFSHFKTLLLELWLWQSAKETLLLQLEALRAGKGKVQRLASSFSINFMKFTVNLLNLASLFPTVCVAFSFSGLVSLLACRSFSLGLHSVLLSRFQVWLPFLHASLSHSTCSWYR